jgi:hypothetical protein
MPIQHALWKTGARPTPLPLGKLGSEQALEDMIAREPGILSAEWMLIGRQEPTGFGGRIDLLAIAPDASLVLIELKRSRTPREIVAQALDYAAWVEKLTAGRIAQIYQRFSKGGNLDTAFAQRFGTKLDAEALNASHQIVLVAAELDAATERIIQYLNDRDLAINVLFFQTFQHGPDLLLSRAWLIDPGQTQANVATTTKNSGEKEPWNGEFYVSFGTGPGRTWEDARQYGFISAGGGTWYVQTLRLLSSGDRIWVKDPGNGYLGVGRVLEPLVALRDFKVPTPSGEKPAMDVLSTADHLRQHADDPDKTEHFVRVDWLDTVPAGKAVNEVGLFGNQNTVCQPTTPKWRHTVERLKQHFPKWNSEVKS